MSRHIGGPPAGFVVMAVVLSVLWFPFRLWLDHDDPTLYTAALSGLWGCLYAVMPMTFSWFSDRRKPDPAPSGEQVAWARRGVVVALAVGVPFHGGLVALCAVIGLHLFMSLHAVVLIAVLAVAAVRWRRTS